MAWACDSNLENTLAYNVLEAIDGEEGHCSGDYLQQQSISLTDQVIPQEPSLQGGRSEENLFDIVNNFSRIPIRNWSKTDTLDWAASVCKRNDIPLYGGVNVTAFQTVTGRDLLGFSQEAFVHLVDPVYGPLFFREFQHFRLKEQRWNQGRNDYGRSLEPDDPYLLDSSQSSDAYQPQSEDLRDLEESISFSDLIYANGLSGDKYLSWDFHRGQPQQGSLDNGLSSTLNTQEPSCFNEQYQGSSSLFPEDLPEMYQNEWSTPSYSVDQNPWSTSAQPVDQSEWSTPFNAIDQTEPLSSPRPSVGSPESSIFEPIPTNTRRGRTRGPKSWEFLLRLLFNPLYNPSHIEWVDRERGVFRLVNKDEIACLWGTREYKGRGKKVNLTYENFSRALRYYYPSKMLLPVMEKHLQYQFGPKVMKLLKENPQQYR